MSRRKRSVCEYLVDEHIDKLREVIRLTNEHNIEHGFTVIGYPNDVRETDIISGDLDTIDIITSTTTAFRPIRIGVHTHPSGAINFSERDWKNFLTEYAQYHPDSEFPIGWGLGSVVAGQRLGEDDTFGIRGLELTEDAAGLSIREQREWVQEAFGVLDDTEFILGSDDARAEMLAPYVDVCTQTVELR